MRRIALLIVAAVLLVLIVAQLVLPGVAEQRLRAAFPILELVRPVASSGGQLTLQGTATLLGVSATVDATVRPLSGALVVTPDVPFGRLATITLFSNPSVRVQGVAADPAPGGF